MADKEGDCLAKILNMKISESLAEVQLTVQLTAHSLADGL